MMTNKMIQGALAMLAGVIPKEEYEKATAALGQIVQLMQSCDDRLKRIEEGQANMRQRLELLEMAAHADMPTFTQARHEQTMWLVEGRVEKALAPAQNGALHNG